MPKISPHAVIRISNWVTFIVSVIGLLDLLYIAPWQCGKSACSLDMAWVFFVIVFVTCVGFSGYRVYRMRRDGV